jgi:tuberous sclerosis 2
MIEPTRSADTRRETLLFYANLIQGQHPELSMMRSHFFRVIQANDSEVDLPHYFRMLKVLTENGKDIQNFEEEFGALLLKWLNQIARTNLTAQYLELTVNVIKFNAAYIDREVIVGIVQRICNDVNVHYIHSDSETFLQCLYLIETVICYTVFPNELLAPCILILCRAVNVAVDVNETNIYLDTSFKIMKCLLGTQLGYASLLTMSSMLSDDRYYFDSHILRGAVFHLNINLWGGSQSSSQNGFKYSSTVLTSYLKVLQSDFENVVFEVLLSIETLLNKCGNDLGEPSWDIIFEILHKIVEKPKFINNPAVSEKFHQVVDLIESKVAEKKVNADVARIYSLIEKISSRRPVRSHKKIEKLIFMNVLFIYRNHQL